MTTAVKVALTLTVLLGALGVLIWRVKLLRALVLGVTFGAIMALTR